MKATQCRIYYVKSMSQAYVAFDRVENVYIIKYRRLCIENKPIIESGRGSPMFLEKQKRLLIPLKLYLRIPWNKPPPSVATANPIIYEYDKY